MKWSIKRGTRRGLDVHLHFWFLLLFGFLMLCFWRATQTDAATDAEALAGQFSRAAA